jgi:signal transduction histidine kinase
VHLADGVAHEISNPNQVIRINTPLLEEIWEDARTNDGSRPRSALADEVPALLQEILAASDRIQLIVSELRAYAHGSTASSMGPVDLNDVVRSALALIAGPVRAATSHFSVRFAEPIPAVLGNMRRIEQVVINLILNACQALTSREQALLIATSSDEEEDVVVVTVRDEGCGIPAEHLAHIFDPFFTTKRERGGTGLGLAIARSIADEHHGRLEFDSTLEQGTSVRLILPANG